MAVEQEGDVTLIIRQNKESKVGCGSSWHYEAHSYFSSCPSCPEGSPSAKISNVRKPYLVDHNLAVIKFPTETVKDLENLASSRKVSLAVLLSEVISESINVLTADK